MPSQRATPAAADRSAVARDEVRPPQRGQRRGYPGTIADLLRRVVRRNPLVEPPQRPLDIHSWHSSRTQSDIAFLDCRCHQADLQKRQSPDRGPRGPHLERTTTLTDLARMTWDQLRAHITDLTEETGALIKADGDSIDGGGWIYEDTGQRVVWIGFGEHNQPCECGCEDRDETPPHPSSLDYNEAYELTSDMARRRIAANLTYWAHRVAAAVTARNRYAGVPAPGGGSRTIRASKPWPAPQAASRTHPSQPAAGTATDTRTAAPA